MAFASGSAIPFDAAALYNMVAFDHRRRKHRLTLGEYQGPTRSQLVLALSSDLPRQLLERSSPSSQRRSAPSPSTPLTLNTIPPFGVYFCRKPTLTALRRDGIHPTSQSTRQGNPLNIALKLQAALQPEMSDTTYYSPLNQQRHGLYLFVNLPATLEAGFTWYMLDPQKGIIGTPKVPLPAAFFHCALAIESGQVVHHWIPTPNEPTLHPPRNRPPVGAPTAEATETYLNTYADIRVEQYLRSPPVIQTGIDISDSHPPRESDHDTEILSQSATEAFQRLIAAIDNPSPTPLDIDDQLYSALAGLSSSHPWSTLVLDLKGVLHELDRHFHTHLLSGMLQAQMVPSKIQLLNQLLQSLSAVIVDILAPATSNFNLPEIESVFFTHQFWHHHLVHGTNIATPASLERAPSDTLLGDQLCQWSSVGATANSLLLASHLTVHLPPRIGAYVLANHKTHASLVTDPEVAGQNSRSNYVVKQRSQYRSPIMGSEMALTAARASASAGHVPPGLVPFLASPNADIIQHRLNWTLRFPLPGPSPNDPNAHRFANLALHASGHNSNESLRNAIQLHQTFSQTNAMVTNPTFLRVPDPSNGTGHLTQHPAVALDPTVARWLSEGAPRVNSRSHPNPATRPFIPAALFSFCDGAISLPQCSQLIAQHHAHSTSHVRIAAQEFTRTEGAQKFIYTRLNTEVIDCCRIYHLPPTASSGTPPASASLTPGTANPMPAPALNVRPRLPAESRSRTPPGPLVPPLFDYETDFPHAIGAPPKAKAKEKERAKAKAKGKANEKVSIPHRRPVPLTLLEKSRAKARDFF